MTKRTQAAEAPATGSPIEYGNHLRTNDGKKDPTRTGGGGGIAVRPLASLPCLRMACRRAVTPALLSTPLRGFSSLHHGGKPTMAVSLEPRANRRTGARVNQIPPDKATPVPRGADAPLGPYPRLGAPAPRRPTHGALRRASTPRRWTRLGARTALGRAG